nr:hypothetical protein [Candidatus Sigynarchaeota archaeon]
MEASPRIKAAIIDQLKKFDALSKEIAAAKKAESRDPGEIDRLNAEIEALNRQSPTLRKELSLEEGVLMDLMNEYSPNAKKLDKQQAKVARIKASIGVIEGKIAAIKDQIGEIEKLREFAKTTEKLQGNYKQILSNLMNLRTRYPQDYDDAEREAGIFFLTTPKEK